jgi:hypothetical protein
MLLARGDAMLFFTRPISLVFMIGTALVLFAPVTRRGQVAGVACAAIQSVSQSFWSLTHDGRSEEAERAGAQPTAGRAHRAGG